MESENATILSIHNLSKSYGGVHALDSVSLDVRPGEVHAIIGENGAGKSTLVKIVSGVVRRDTGIIRFGGEEVQFDTPRQAIESGVSVIHQELSMLPDLNVIENIFSGRMKGRLGIVNWSLLAENAREALDVVEADIDPYAIVDGLSISDRQMVEIAKAVDKNCRVLIMDEPNSSLSEHETEVLFRIIGKLKSDGIAIVYISHKLDEVLLIADRITALRDGKYVGTVETADADVDQLVGMMVGRDLVRGERRNREQTEPVLEVKNLSGDRYSDVSFELQRGEILGFSGLVGSGRSEVARAVFGADAFHSGEILYEGKAVRFRSPREAIEAGVAMLQEDRKKLSLFMDQSVLSNVSIAQLPHLSRGGVIDSRKVRETVSDYVKSLRIRLGGLNHAVSSLSGGNQQKTIVGRWLATEPNVLILDEPTHGVDIGAKAELYQKIQALANGGMSIILISSELPEIIALSDRVVVMRGGVVEAILDHDRLDEETIMAYAAGGTVREEEIQI